MVKRIELDTEADAVLRDLDISNVEAARRLGISEPTLRRRRAALGLSEKQNRYRNNGRPSEAGSVRALAEILGWSREKTRRYREQILKYGEIFRQSDVQQSKYSQEWANYFWCHATAWPGFRDEILAQIFTKDCLSAEDRIHNPVTTAEIQDYREYHHGVRLVSDLNKRIPEILEEATSFEDAGDLMDLWVTEAKLFSSAPE